MYLMKDYYTIVKLSIVSSPSSEEINNFHLIASSIKSVKLIGCNYKHINRKKKWNFPKRFVITFRNIIS